ncbi:hypothetical protein C4E22_00140 [ANME-1 cluster archaeon AG-394-G06]|nr:hypothetical protein [ANME-1 cluster archaeon AG-394-G06]
MATSTTRQNKILAIIPACGGSKGIPRKNIKLLAGKLLITYSIRAALKTRYSNSIVVSTWILAIICTINKTSMAIYRPIASDKAYKEKFKAWCI